MRELTICLGHVYQYVGVFLKSESMESRLFIAKWIIFSYHGENKTYVDEKKVISVFNTELDLYNPSSMKQQAKKDTLTHYPYS